MTGKAHAHELIVWTKQRLDDLDTTISEVEKAAANLKDNARQQADRTLARLKQVREKLREYSDNLRAETDVAKQRAEEIKEAIENEWAEAEVTFQAFLSSIKDQADTVQHIIRARAQAQHQSWESTTKKLRDQATNFVEKARSDVDAAIQHLTREVERLQGQLGKVEDAGNESWKAIKNGLAGAKEVHDRTIHKIKEELSKLY